MTKTSPGSIIRPYRDEDWSSLWPIIRDTVAAGETYVYDRDISEARARSIWLGHAEGAVAVAANADGRIVGSAKMGPNHAGPGAHVATASFMVDFGHRGHGVGEALARHALAWAAASGFRAMQFNAVVETNTRAVLLWRRLGFSILGTAPDAFDHPRHGFVGLHIMHMFLSADTAEPEVRGASATIEGDQR